MIPESAYLLLIAAIGVERCFELALSLRNARIAFSRGAIETGRDHYPFMVALHALLLSSCAIGSLLSAQTPAPSVATLALIGVIAAQALRCWTMLALGERWNTRIIVIPGETPVTAGPYRYLRHPNYLAVAIEVGSLPLIRGLWTIAILFSAANALLLYVRIRAEERALGAPYALAFSSRRRMLPSLPR